MSTHDKHKPRDHSDWEGDPEQLIGHEEELARDEDLCERLFMSKHEAFETGRLLISLRHSGTNRLSAVPARHRGDEMEILQRVAWGDMDGSAETLSRSLRLAMEATSDGFRLWNDDDEGERLFGDEYSLTPAQVEQLSPEWRVAYVARLLRSAAIMWGVDADWGDGTFDSDKRFTGRPAALLHDLSLASRGK